MGKVFKKGPPQVFLKHISFDELLFIEKFNNGPLLGLVCHWCIKPILAALFCPLHIHPFEDNVKFSFFNATATTSCQ